MIIGCKEGARPWQGSFPSNPTRLWLPRKGKRDLPNEQVLADVRARQVDAGGNIGCAAGCKRNDQRDRTHQIGPPEARYADSARDQLQKLSAANLMVPAQSEFAAAD